MLSPATDTDALLSSPDRLLTPLRKSVGARMQQPMRLMISRLMVKRFAVVRSPGVIQKAHNASRLMMNEMSSRASIRKSMAISLGS